MKVSRFAILFVLTLTFAIGAAAQSSELAFTVGGNFPKNNQYDPGTSLAVGAQYDGRIIHVPLAALYFDVPLVVSTKSSFTDPVSSARNNIRSWFLTPGLKVKFAPELPVSPYFVGGVGFAHYGVTNVGTVLGDTSVNKGVFEVGGGVDMKIAPFVSVRGEVRDFISGTPSVAAIQDTGRQHNVVPQVGLVFRF